MILTAFVLLLVLLAIALPVAATLGIMGLTLDALYSNLPLSRALAEVGWTSSNGFVLLSVPLFVMLGEVLLRSGLADKMYDSMTAWLGWLPGGLMHSNVGASALFAATCGSSAATAATIATVALPQAKKHNYSPGLFAGSLAAGGTLGILIPPSGNMIIYGIITNTSIPKLYLAGIVPGILLALLFMLVILVACVVKPALGGSIPAASWAERLKSLIDLLPPLIIFATVIGSIYSGLATATESAALGLVAAFILVALKGRLTLRLVELVLESSMRTTAMIIMIIVAAFFLNFVIGGIGIVQQINNFVTGLAIGKYELLCVIVVFYLILGCFMETLSIMVVTLPIVAPVMFKAGFDPVWFGIIVIILIEAALITPPVGLNLYVIQGVRKEGSINEVIAGSAPFVIAMGLLIVLLTIFPQIALYLVGASGAS